MAEYRIEGVAATGRPVIGVIDAVNLKTAKKHASKIANQRKFRVNAIRPRSRYIYRVQQGSEKPVDGEQAAFSKQDVEEALTKMNLRVIYVRKKLFDFQFRPPDREIVTFVRVSAELIQQNLPYNEVLQMLSNDISNKPLREAVRDVNLELKRGKDSQQVYKKHERVFGKFAAHMFGLASKSGNMAEMYDNTAKFLERRLQFKKDLKSALIMPTVTVLFTIGALLYFVGYIFPRTAKLFQTFGIKLPPMTAVTLVISDAMVANVWWILLAFAVVLAGMLRFFFSEKHAFTRDRLIWKIPVLGPLVQKINIEIFCRVFTALYTGSGENIDVIRTAAEACGNKYMEHQLKTVAIPLMTDRGAGITEAFQASGVFTKTAISRFHSGSQTGSVKHSAQQIADYYESETKYKMLAVIDLIQVFVAILIMIVLIYITVVSAETAIIRPKHPMMR